MVNKCGECAHAQVIPQDITKRVCKGGPPQIVVVPTQQGLAIQTMFPMVNATDDGCGAYKPKVILDTDNNGA